MKDLESFSCLSVQDRVRALEESTVNTDTRDEDETSEIELNDDSGESEKGNSIKNNLEGDSNISIMETIARPPPIVIPSTNNTPTRHNPNLNSPLEYSSSSSNSSVYSNHSGDSGESGESELEWSQNCFEEDDDERKIQQSQIFVHEAQNGIAPNDNNQTYPNSLEIENDDFTCYTPQIEYPQTALNKTSSPENESIIGDSTKNTNKRVTHRKSLIDLKNAQGQSPLKLASNQLSFKIMRALVSSGADVNTTDDNGNTPLHSVVCQDVNNQFYDMDNHHKCMQLLLSENTDVNIQNNLGQTSLHLAAEAGCEECLHILLSNGASGCVQDSNGDTPLHLSVETKNLECVKKIMSFPCIDDCKFCSMTLASNEQACKRACGDDYRDDINSAEGQNISNLNIDQSVQKQHKESNTSIDGAKYENEINNERSMVIWNRFFQNSMMQDSRNTQMNQNPLHSACLQGDIDQVFDLIDDGIDVDGKDEMWNTPLHLATKEHHVQVVKALLQSGSRTDIENKLGETPISISFSKAYMDCSRLLLEYDTKQQRDENLKNRTDTRTSEFDQHNSNGSISEHYDGDFRSQNSSYKKDDHSMSVGQYKQGSFLSNDESSANYSKRNEYEDKVCNEMSPDIIENEEARGVRYNSQKYWAYNVYRPMDIPKDLAVALEKAKSLKM